MYVEGQLGLEEYQELVYALQMSRLMKAGAEVGEGAGIQQGVGFTGGFTPLVPQNIDFNYSSETFEAQDLVIQKDLVEKPVNSPIYEVTTYLEYGNDDVESFFGEGSSTSIETSKLERKFVSVKFQGVKRQISDVAGATAILGNNMVSKSGLERERSAGIKSLAKKYERALFRADSSLSPLHFDGIIPQIRSLSPADNVVDMRGGKMSIQDFVGKIFANSDEPNFGHTDRVYVPGILLGQLINIATSHGRFSQPQTGGVAKMGSYTLVYNPAGLFVVGPRGNMIEIKAAPLMRELEAFKATAAGDAPPATILGDITVAVIADPGDDLFTAADAGDYYYVIKARGDKGSSAALSVVAAATVAAGQRVRFTIDDAAKPTSGDNSVRYYDVYRSAKGAADGSAAKFLGSFARNEDGGSDETIFYDANENLPGTTEVLGLQTDADSIYVANLLGVIQRPLAEPETAKPFMVMHFRAPHVVHPRKQLMWRNADLTL